MANTRLITSFLGYTASATSADANFPATNVSIYGHPFRPWKALVATGIVDLTLDLGVGKTLSALAADPGLFLYPTNVTSVRIQGNSSLSWGAPPWDQLVTIAKDRLTGRYKGFFRLADLNAAAFAYRYLNLRIPSQTPVDGLPYRIGMVAVGNVTELSVNPSSPVVRNRLDPALTVDFLDGGREVMEMGEPVVELSLPRHLFDTTELNEALDIDALGLGLPFVYWDAIMGTTDSGWLVRRQAPPRMSQPWVTVHEGELALREVT